MGAVGYSAKAVANYFISNSGKDGVSPLKLQKLVYISHGWCLGIIGESLVADEYAEAWKYGPVFSSLYHEFKDFGSKQITRKATDLDDDFELFTPHVDKTDIQTINLLKKVWDVYGHFSAGQLSSLTHKNGSPWHQANDKGENRINIHISDEIIKEYYKELEKNVRK